MFITTITTQQAQYLSWLAFEKLIFFSYIWLQGYSYLWTNSGSSNTSTSTTVRMCVCVYMCACVHAHVCVCVCAYTYICAVKVCTFICMTMHIFVSALHWWAPIGRNSHICKKDAANLQLLATLQDTGIVYIHTYTGSWIAWSFCTHPSWVHK